MSISAMSPSMRPSMLRRLLVLCWGVSAAAGCHGRAPVVSPAPAASVAAAVAPALAPVPASPAVPTTLFERLSREAAQRPIGTLRPEAVKEALVRAGIALEGWQQVLGSTVGASFCMAGHTPQGLGVALCEYADAAQAARGLAYSRATFDRLIPHRELTVKRSTLLTIAPPLAPPLAPTPGSSAGPDELNQIQRTFASL